MCPIPDCNETFDQRELLTRHVEFDHQQALSIETDIRTAATISSCGKYSCYFDGCNLTFDDTNKLNEHLMAGHNMLYKDIDARSKMNLLFLEQIKHQIAGQYALGNAADGGDGANGNIHQLSHSTVANPYKEEEVDVDDSHLIRDVTDIGTRHHNYFKQDKKIKADSQVRLC